MTYEVTRGVGYDQTEDITRSFIKTEFHYHEKRYMVDWSVNERLHRDNVYGWESDASTRN